MSVRFRVTTPTGEVVIGPIQGNGGHIGDGSMHAGYDRAARAAERSIRLAKDRFNHGLDTGLFEPRQGYVSVSLSDEASVDVPLAGSEFEVIEARDALHKLREQLRRGIEWIQNDFGQDSEAHLTHHGIHGGKWEIDGYPFSIRLGIGLAAESKGEPILSTRSCAAVVRGQDGFMGRPQMPRAVWDKIKKVLLDLGVPVTYEWQHVERAYSCKLDGIEFGAAYQRMQANCGTMFCADCPRKQDKDPSSTFCSCDFLAERSARVVYPEGWC